jgi:hypothetical protein
MTKIQPEFSIYSNSSFNLYNFYIEYGDVWYEHVENLVNKITQDTCVVYNTTTFLENRESFKHDLFLNIQSNFTSIFKNIFSLYKLEIGYIKFNILLEEAIEGKLLQSQKIKVYSIQNQISIIKKETEKIIAELNSEIENMNINSLIYFQNVKASIRDQCWDYLLKNDMITYKNLDKDLSLSSDGNLINFIYTNEILSTDHKNYINFDEITKSNN